MELIKNNRFKFFAPASILEKGKDKDGNEVYEVGGLISDESEDSDDETLDCKNFDMSEFYFINWDHQKGPKYIIGEPHTWKYVPGKGLMMNGVIWGDSELGRDAVRLMKALEKSPRGTKLGWSVEGQVIERDLVNPKRVKKAKITAVALCPFPKNGHTYAELVKKGFTGDDIYQDNDSLEYECLEKGLVIEELNENGEYVSVDKEGNIRFEKSQGTENTRPLVKEDVEDDEKILKAVCDVVEGYHRGTVSREEIEKIAKCDRIMNLTKKFV